MICLGIESTAHTFGIGIINDKGEILADIKDMYTSKTGIIMDDATTHHEKLKEEILEKALNHAKLNIKNIQLIAYSQGPGLDPCLHIGRKFALELGLSNKIEVRGVNHVAGHLELGKLLTGTKDPVYVFTSGANTQIIALEAGKYRIFGEALSVGLGNAFDKFGRTIGIGFPAGAKIEKLALKGKYIPFPYTVKGMDVEFSGILTKAQQLYKQGAKKEDLCYSLQETGFAMLAEVTERALAHTNKTEALLIGGVAANQRFCQMLDLMCKQRNAKFYACPLKYSGDNGTQIAWQGIVEHKNNIPKHSNEKTLPRWRIDKVIVK